MKYEMKKKNVKLIWCKDWSTVGPNCKSPPEMRFNKNREIDGSYCACNDLTNFECEAQATGNGSCENFQKLAWKIS